MSSLAIKNIRYLVADEGILERVHLKSEGGIITYIGKEPVEADESIDASSMVIYPGLINTHHHLYQTFSRNLPEVQNMELFPWLKTLYEIWKHLNADVVYYSSLIGLAELLKTGCTTCLDHHYVFPKDSQDDLIGVQFQASEALGIRMHATRGGMDLSVKDGGLPPDSVVQSVDEIIKNSEDVIRRHHDPHPFSMKQVVLAPCSPFSVSKRLLTESRDLARREGVRLHTHLAETKDEEIYTIKRYGMRPLEYMEDIGWIGADVWFAHGIHFNDKELELLAKTKTGVAHCPVSNMKLSSGIAKIPEMLRLKVPVGLAVDGSASNDGSSMLEEMRVAYLLHRLNSSQSAPTGSEILKIATQGSAELLGRTELGSLKVGNAMDCFMINLNRPSLAGCQYDVSSIPAVVGFRECVDMTIVNGIVVVKDGRLVGMDEEKLFFDANKTLKKYLRREG